MLERLEGVEKRYREIERVLSDPDIMGDREAYKKHMKEHADLGKIVHVYRRYKETLAGIKGSKELLHDPDPEMKALAKEELDSLQEEKEKLEEELKVLLLPRDPNDERSIILEIRAGTGGEEAALFAGDLFRMYCRYAETRNWRVELMDANETDNHGYKEVIANIHGEGAYSAFKYESGTHRVQRVPLTEAQGRIHTSAVTVAVLPEAEEVDVKIDPNELRIDVYRSTGPGGQSVNTTDSAVRVTHLPTGLVVICQDEKSQHKNKAKALKVLRSRLLDMEIRKQQEEIAQERKSQIGSGDRSERIRTYNYPQSRMTDHRIGLTLYRLESIMQGDIQEVIEAIRTHYQAEALKAGAAQ
jgi:peptide chain release factor 1